MWNLPYNVTLGTFGHLQGVEVGIYGEITNSPKYTGSPHLGHLDISSEEEGLEVEFTDWCEADLRLAVLLMKDI